MVLIGSLDHVTMKIIYVNFVQHHKIWHLNSLMHHQQTVNKKKEEEEAESRVTEYFTCNDGCNVIDMKWVNDGSWCDCQDCSDESEWTCDSCATRCPDTYAEVEFTYCWSKLNFKVSSSNSHTDNSYNTGSGTHCG